MCLNASHTQWYFWLVKSHRVKMGMLDLRLRCSTFWAESGEKEWSKWGWVGMRPCITTNQNNEEADSHWLSSVHWETSFVPTESVSFGTVQSWRNFWTRKLMTSCLLSGKKALQARVWAPRAPSTTIAQQLNFYEGFFTDVVFVCCDNTHSFAQSDKIKPWVSFLFLF